MRRSLQRARPSSVLQSARKARGTLGERPASTSAAQPLPAPGGSADDEVARPRGTMKNEQIAELLYQALETERGGIEVYTAALECVLNDDLKKEWQEYLEQTRNHERI